ncbi:MAG: hypothetical protein EBY28_22185, partial [Betaproteobacteria bacterium]|nr:hypothetical protein [Betaproteobacteria bacterium]
MILANISGLSINTAGGNVNLAGLINSGNAYSGVAGSSGTGSWDAALAAAKVGTGSAVGDTYLATITSRLENALASRAVGYAGAWFGARRDASNGSG